MNNEELQSRREFFKDAAKASLPIFGLAVLGTGLFSSCEREEGDKKTTHSCNGCSGSCSSSCSGSCDDSCTGDCYGCRGL